MANGLSLGDAYGATLERVKAQGRAKAKLGMAAIMWISHSERPLQVDEICHALGVEIGSTDLRTDNVPSIWTVISCCQGLATVDKEASTVRLIHFTFQEYLHGHPDPLGSAHSTMAETCLTYLNSQQVRSLPANPPHDLRDTPFLGYSSLYWGTHAKIEFSDRVKLFALELLDQYEDHVSAKLLLRAICPGAAAGDAPGPERFTALHCVSYFGITDIAIALTKMKRWDANQRDSAGMTPLIWAARCGHGEVVKLLLGQKHTVPDEPDTVYGRTALSWAAGNGHEGVVRLFLGREFVNPNRWWGRAIRVPNLLLGRKYVNPDRPDTSYDRTPLSWAAENGHDGAVKLLLGREDINPNRPDKEHSKTPLSWAAWNGHNEVVRLLLEREDVDPDKPDELHRTPVLLAARRGHEGVVKLLLERKDVHPDKPDELGRTPISRAAENGCEGVVKLLLGRRDVKPDSANSGRTPLWWAVKKGHEGVVKALLERRDVNPDSTYGGRTPLWWAINTGHEGIVKLLLARSDVNPDRPDICGRTPLSWAAENGRTRLVRLLLRRGDVNPERPDKCGQTPLSRAARNGQDEVVGLLKARKASTASSMPQTPGPQTPTTPLRTAVV